MSDSTTRATAAHRVLLSTPLFPAALIAAAIDSGFAGYTGARHEWGWMAVAIALAVGLWSCVIHIAFLLGVDHAER